MPTPQEIGFYGISDAMKAEGPPPEANQIAPTGASGPANTGTPGKRTPSERARLAALARWGKYKAKPKQKGKGRQKKQAQTPEAKEAQRRQEAQANRASVMDSFGSFGRDTLPDMEALAQGGELDPKKADLMIQSGLAERLENGTVVLSREGKQLYNAASKGDRAAAKEAIAKAESNAMERQGKDKAKAEKDKAKADKEAADKEKEAAPKGGGGGGSSKPSDEEKEAQRKEKADKKKQATREDVKQRMADSDTGLSPAGFDGFVSFADGGPMDSALAAGFREMGVVEGDPPRLTEAGRSLRNAIDRGDLRGAVDAVERGKSKKAEGDERAKTKADRDAAALTRAAERDAEKKKRDEEKEERAKRGPRRPLRDGIRISTKDITMDYADALNGLLDIADGLEQPDATKAGKRHSASDTALIQAIYDAACGVCEMAVRLGAVEEMDETVEDAMDYSVKMLPDGKVGGYAVRFGSPEEPDISPFHDFFTKSTEFWVEHWQTRPMLFHHAQDEDTKGVPVVGTWTKARTDDIGIWLEGQIDMAHRYAAAVKELVRRGLVRLSSDSAPHLVIREPQPNGTNWVKRWPMLAASLTVSPAEPRLLPVSALKAAFDAAGLELPPAFLDETDEGDLSAIDADPEATKAQTEVEDRADPPAETSMDPDRERLLTLRLRHLRIKELA